MKDEFKKHSALSAQHSAFAKGESQNIELSLWNAGTLPIELSIDKLFQLHKSIPRNPLIAEVCYRAGYIDSWGRGIKTITDACEQAGLPKPIIEEETGGVEVSLLKAPASEKVVSDETRVKTPVETLAKTRVKTPDAILQTLKEDSSLTLAEVADRIGKSISAVERAAKKLRDQGKLEYIGPQKGGHWEVKK